MAFASLGRGGEEDEEEKGMGKRRRAERVKSRCVGLVARGKGYGKQS